MDPQQQRLLVRAAAAIHQSRPPPQTEIQFAGGQLG